MVNRKPNIPIRAGSTLAKCDELAHAAGMTDEHVVEFGNAVDKLIDGSLWYVIGSSKTDLVFSVFIDDSQLNILEFSLGPIYFSQNDGFTADELFRLVQKLLANGGPKVTHYIIKHWWNIMFFAQGDELTWTFGDQKLVLQAKETDHKYIKRDQVSHLL